jgi:hypothetical protein
MNSYRIGKSSYYVTDSGMIVLKSHYKEDGLPEFLHINPNICYDGNHRVSISLETAAPQRYLVLDLINQAKASVDPHYFGVLARDINNRGTRQFKQKVDERIYEFYILKGLPYYIAAYDHACATSYLHRRISRYIATLKSDNS